MLDREIASAMRYIIDSSGGPHPFYWRIPQDFLTPAVYFPEPEIETTGYTLRDYALNFRWFVKFFDKDTQGAYNMGFAALTEIQRHRGLIPLIDENGEYIGRGFRMTDSRLKTVDDGAAQLTLNWVSPRPYHVERPPKMMRYNLFVFVKSAMEKAVEQIGG